VKKIGLVLEGGSFRGIFTAGVLDFLLDKNISFPYVIGVSAGSGNGVNFIAKQKGRTQKVITHENAEPYYGFGQFKQSRKMLDLDKMVYEYSYNQIPLDFDAFLNANIESEFVVASCETGEPEYLSADNTKERILQICKASMSVPIICQPTEIDGKHYLDGSTLDSVPYRRALEKGCEKVVVVMTRDEHDEPTDYNKVKLLLNICYRSKYPKVVEAMLKRKSLYEKQIKGLKSLEKKGRAFVIRPEGLNIGHFEKDMEKVNEFYRHGYDVMEKRFDELQAFLEA
jgi:predicted patatin/cPLA2 family phospholipase